MTRVLWPIRTTAPLISTSTIPSPGTDGEACATTGTNTGSWRGGN